MSASLEIQTAIFDLLTNSPDVTVSVFEDVPDGTAYPYIQLGESTFVDDGTKTEIGQIHTLTNHAWSRYDGSKEVKEITGQMYDVLHNANLVLPNHSAMPVIVEFERIFKDADGQTYHGVQRIRVRTQPKP